MKIHNKNVHISFHKNVIIFFISLFFFSSFIFLLFFSLSFVLFVLGYASMSYRHYFDKREIFLPIRSPDALENNNKRNLSKIYIWNKFSGVRMSFEIIFFLFFFIFRCWVFLMIFHFTDLFLLIRNASFCLIFFLCVFCCLNSMSFMFRFFFSSSGCCCLWCSCKTYLFFLLLLLLNQTICRCRKSKCKCLSLLICFTLHNSLSVKNSWIFRRKFFFFKFVFDSAKEKKTSNDAVATISFFFKTKIQFPFEWTQGSLSNRFGYIIRNPMTMAILLEENLIWCDTISLLNNSVTYIYISF